MKPIVTLIVAACAFLAFLFAVVCMPAAELLPAQSEPGSIAPGLSPVRSRGVMDAFAGVGRTLSQTFFQTDNLETYTQGDPLSYGKQNMPGELKAYMMWAVFLSLAMVFAAIGLGAVGRYDSEEKTVLPVKK